MCRHFLRNLKWNRPISGAKNWRHSLPSAAPVRPASAPFPYSAALRSPTGATTNDLTPCRMPLVLSAPPLVLRLRQNKRPYDYAGVVVHRSSAAAPSTSMYSFVEISSFTAAAAMGHFDPSGDISRDHCNQQSFGHAPPHTPPIYKSSRASTPRVVVMIT